MIDISMCSCMHNIYTNIIYDDTVFVTLDMMERINVGDVSVPGRSTFHGCFRCKQTSYGLFDSTKWPYNYLRGQIDYLSVVGANRDISIDSLSRDHGYNSYQYMKHQINGIGNLHTRMTVDINHDAKNKCEQLDRCIKNDYLQVSSTYTFCYNYNNK